MRILITGGGTAGHINPAIAIAQSLKKSNPSNSILFVGAKGKMETFLVREAGFALAEISMDGLVRSNPFKNLFLPFKYIYSYYKTKKILNYFKPDIMIGTGGYVTVPVIQASQNFKIPSIILEQNTTPGLANKILSKIASKIIVGFEDCSKYFPSQKTVFINNPIREELTKTISRTKAAKFFGFDSKKKTIFILGGSLGAQTINLSVLSHLKTIYDNDIQVLWQTGINNYKKIVTKLPKEIKNLVLPIPYIENIAYAYACADLVLGRGGALTITEISYLGKPAILVPSPNVTNNHQYKNILPFVENDAILSLSDKESRKYLIPNAIELLNQPKILKLLSKNIKKLYDVDSNKKIINVIQRLPYDPKFILTKNIRDRFTYIYLLGIGGIGMSSLARWFNNLGLKVFGYDHKSSPLTSKLKEEGITIGFENGIRFIPRELLDHSNKTLVINTAAIKKDNEVLKHMSDLGSAVYKRSEILGKLSEENLTVAVGGTHGKTTVTAIISHILKTANVPMRSFIGGVLKKYETNFIINKKFSNKTITVLEADEFDKSFLKLSPDISIITAADLDHTDIYKNQKNLNDTFKQLCKNTNNKGQLILEKEVKNKLFNKIPSEYIDRINTYDIKDGQMVYNIRNYNNGVIFSFRIKNILISNIKMPLSGNYNIANAVSSIICCLLLKVKSTDIKKGLETFPGIYRRFDYLVNKPNFVFINDYAHHPIEIEAILNTIKEKYPYKKISVIFQPHLYTRTKHFASAFAKSLSLGDKIYLLPIFPAREEPIKGVSSKIIYTKIRSPKVKKNLVEFDDIIKKIKKDGRPEVLVLLGAGDTDQLINPIISEFDRYK